MDNIAEALLTASKTVWGRKMRTKYEIKTKAN